MLQAALIAALDVGVTFDADLMRTVTSTPPHIYNRNNDVESATNVVRWRSVRDAHP
ncbi:predicted protein [Histoplasma mississippiense (nom. inval.)]|uniref:predicted protein n=1 Tax=Ajellomyces capsulatus (strain NAm1 / WU24) TaxID=2059318 RepID=UPI000157BE27|nr:predicted protein [Histoplasma mississippiense (nom. inval.)]EDN06685.1 predicted protein [Histoplasma mississippiense (nom. inval.)]